MVTAITAQNTQGVRAVHAVPPEIVAAQLAALAEDLPPAALKSGMLATAALVGLIAQTLVERRWSRYVLDPVMVATSGDRLLDGDAEALIRERLLPLALIVTPNLDEAAILTGMPVEDADTMEAAGRRLVDLGARAALVKGGHLDGPQIVDVLVTGSGVHRYVHSKITTTSTHGGGCTLSAGIAAGLAKRGSGDGTVEDAVLEVCVSDAIDYLHRAIKSAPALGGGHGPVNHWA